MFIYLVGELSVSDGLRSVGGLQVASGWLMQTPLGLFVLASGWLARSQWVAYVNSFGFICYSQWVVSTDSIGIFCSLLWPEGGLRRCWQFFVIVSAWFAQIR